MKPAIIINTEREGYAPDQISKTMTVSELIESLSEYDPETPVFLAFDNRYTYGGVRYSRIEEIDLESEE